MSYSGTQVYFPAATSFKAIRAALATRFPAAKRTALDGAVALSFGGIKIVRVAHEAHEYVAEEARWLGERAPPDLQGALARTTHRVIIAPEDPLADPDDLYNELLAVFEALYAMPDAVGADPFDGSLHRAPATVRRAAPARKSAAKRSVAKQQAAKRSPAKKAPAKSSAKKSSAKKSSAKSVAKKSPAKSVAKKPSAKKSSAKKSPAKKSPAKSLAQK